MEIVGSCGWQPDSPLERLFPGKCYWILFSLWNGFLFLFFFFSRRLSLCGNYPQLLHAFSQFSKRWSSVIKKEPDFLDKTDLKETTLKADTSSCISHDYRCTSLCLVQVMGHNREKVFLLSLHEKAGLCWNGSKKDRIIYFVFSSPLLISPKETGQETVLVLAQQSKFHVIE